MSEPSLSGIGNDTENVAIDTGVCVDVGVCMGVGVDCGYPELLLPPTLWTDGT